jgi:hypothetical protein
MMRAHLNHRCLFFQLALLHRFFHSTFEYYRPSAMVLQQIWDPDVSTTLALALLLAQASR